MRREPAAGRPRWHGLALLALTEGALLAVGVTVGWLPAVLGSAVAVALWLLKPDFRWPYLASLTAGIFTLYTQGHLTRDLSIVVVLGSLAAALGIREYRQRGWRLPRNGLTTALALWVAVAVYGVVLGLVRGNSLKFIGTDLAGWLGILTAVLAPLWRTRRRAFLGVVVAFTALSYINSVYGLAAFIQFRQRIGDGWFGPLPTMGAVLLIAVAMHTPRSPVRWGAMALSVLPLLHMLLSFTRGYWLGFLGALVSILALRIATSRHRLRESLAAAGALLAVAAVTVTAFYTAQALLGADLSSSVGSRFESSFSTQASSATGSNIIRLAEWRIALEQVARNPVAGYGAGATIVMQDPFVGFRTEQPFIHQMYILQWFKCGLAGLLALLYLFWAFCRAGWREGRGGPSWERRAMGAAVLGNTVLMAVLCTSNFSLALIFAGAPLGFLWGLLLPVSGPEGANRMDWNGGPPGSLSR
jgi:O-antigen ligase